MGRTVKDEELGTQPAPRNEVLVSPSYVEGATPHMHPSYPGQEGAQKLPNPVPIYGIPIGNNTSVLNVVLRSFGFLFSLMAFAVMVSAMNYNGTHPEANMVFLAAMNAIAMVYSLVQAIAGCMSLSRASIIPSPLLEYLCVIADATFAVLLLACSSATASNHQSWLDAINFSGSVCNAAFCQKVTASIAMSFIAFIFLLCSAVKSGFLLAKVSSCYVTKINK